MLVTFKQFLRETARLRDHQRRTDVLPFFDRSIDLIGRNLHENHSSDHACLLFWSALTRQRFWKSGDESPHSKFTHPESCPTFPRLPAALRDSIRRPGEIRSSIHKAG